jgi:hypothetical protein
VLRVTEILICIAVRLAFSVVSFLAGITYCFFTDLISTLVITKRGVFLLISTGPNRPLDP